jgi:hypothetical protein
MVTIPRPRYIKAEANTTLVDDQEGNGMESNRVLVPLRPEIERG